jgi:hypothetical protein
MFGNQADSVHWMLALTKEVCPGAITTVGGVHPSYCVEGCLQDPNLDYVFIWATPQGPRCGEPIVTPSSSTASRPTRPGPNGTAAARRHMYLTFNRTSEGDQRRRYYAVKRGSFRALDDGRKNHFGFRVFESAHGTQGGS